MISRYEFEILSYLEREGQISRSIRSLADTLCLSGGTVLSVLDALEARELIRRTDQNLSITSYGLDALEPYRVKRAIIVAAGFGSRMMPATADKPKPMVTVNGVRIIDTLLDALVKVGITDIVVVGGYQFEKLKELLQKYPFIRLLNNTHYESENNISSAIIALDYMRDGCYFCEADLYISNPEVILKYQYSSNILGAYSMETDDWSFKMQDGCVSEYKKGNTFCYNYYGISYWTPEDCKKLCADWAEVYSAPEGKDLFWEFVPFINKRSNYRVEIRPCRKQDIIEIDNYYELAQLDPMYRDAR